MSDTITLEIRVRGNYADLMQALRDSLKETQFEALEPHRDIGTVVEVIKIVGGAVALTRELIQLAKLLRELRGEKVVKAEVVNELGVRQDLLTVKESTLCKLF